MNPTEAERLASQLMPFILRRIPSAGTTLLPSGGVAVPPSSTLTSHDLDNLLIHTGTLADSQAPQFLLRAGGNLTGNVTANTGVTVDGVDISAHASDANAHHPKSHVLATDSALGPDHTVSGLTAGHYLRALGATTAAFDAILDADIPATIVRTSRTVDSGVGLTGGGNLGADLTLAVGAGAGITVNANDVALATTVSGAGLLFSSPGVLAVGVAHTGAIGLTVEPDAIRLTSSSNPGSAAAILASTASGGLTLAALTVTGSVVVDQALSAADGGFYAGRYGSPGAYYTRVGINKVPTDDQFDLDVAGNIRTDGYFVGKHAIQIAAARAIIHFDGKNETDTTNGTPTSHRGHAPTAATEYNTIRYVRGKFGKARDFVRAATVNLNTNGGFENNSTTGYSSDSVGGANYSKTITTEHVYEGTYALLMRLGDTGTANIYRNPLALAGSTAYSISLYVKPVSDGATLDNVLLYLAGSLIAHTKHDAGDGWTLITGYATTPAVPVSAVHAITGLTTGATYAVDNWQITATAEPQAYTAEITTTASVLGYPTLTPRWDAGSICMWIRPYGFVVGGAGIFGIGATSQWDGYIVTDGRIGFRTNGTTLASTGTLTRGKWSHVVLTWSPAGKKIYIDGLLSSATGAYAYTIQTGNFYIGTMSGSLSNTANAAIDDFALIDRAMSADEIRTIYESNAPIFGESATFQFRAGDRIKVWADENGLFATSNANAAAFAIYNGAAPTFSWGGINLEDADVLIGDPSRGASLLWDNSTNQLKLDKADIAAWNGANQTVSITAAGAMKLGSNVASATTTTFEHTTAGAVRFGATGANKPNLYWDGSTLSLRNNTTPVITLDNAGAAYFAGVVTVGSAGEIRQGTGTPGAVGTWSPAAWGSFTGMRIGADSSARGRIGGYNAGILQWYNDTDGKLYAGAGQIVISATGIRAMTSHTFSNTSTTYPELPAYSNITTGTKYKFFDDGESVWYGGINYVDYDGGEIGALTGSSTINCNPMYPDNWYTSHTLALRIPDTFPKAEAPGYPGAKAYARAIFAFKDYQLGIYVQDDVAYPYFRDTTLVSHLLWYGQDRTLQTGTTTGVIISGAAAQKLAFHGKTAVIQRANASQSAVATTGATNTTPYGFTTAAQANAIVTLVNELRDALVEKGIIKGSA